MTEHTTNTASNECKTIQVGYAGVNKSKPAKAYIYYSSKAGTEPLKYLKDVKVQSVKEPTIGQLVTKKPPKNRSARDKPYVMNKNSSVRDKETKKKLPDSKLLESVLNFEVGKTNMGITKSTHVTEI